MITAHLVRTGMQISLGAKTQMMNGASQTTSGATFLPSVRDLSQQFTLTIQIMKISSTGGSAKRRKLAVHLKKTKMGHQTQIQSTPVHECQSRNLTTM